MSASVIYGKKDAPRFMVMTLLHFIACFMNFNVKYNLVHEDEIMKMFTLCIRKHPR